MIKALAFIALVALPMAFGSCPDSCSGHGTCGVNDKCTCYKNWQGGNCAARTCSFSRSWKESSHSYAECADMGTCDRATGLCDCLDGFTGQGCERLACPEGCSGHGTCESITELGHASYDGAWDATKSYGCKCDPGFTGVDCAGRMCPRGDDPLTKNVDNTHVTTTSMEKAEVQNVTVQGVGGVQMNGGQVTFTYTDLYSAEWTTRPVNLPAVQTVSNKNTKIQTGAFEWTPVAYEVTTVLAATNNVASASTAAVTFGGIKGASATANSYTVAQNIVGATDTHVLIEASDGPSANYEDTNCGLPTGLITTSAVTCAGTCTAASTADDDLVLTAKINNAVLTATSGTCDSGIVKMKFLISVKTFATTSETMADVVTGKDIEVYKHTLTGYVSTAAAASQLRRGDQIMLGTRNGDEACMVTIAKDVNPCEGATTCNGGVDTYLWVMAEPGRPQCNPITPTTASATTANNRDATVFVYSQWKQTYITADSPLVNNDAKRQEFSQSLGTSNTAHQASVTSLSKTSSSYYTLTAALGTDPGAASVFGRELLPGTWLRIYDETSVGNFCDVEVKATPKDNSGTSQYIHVMPATTTTYNYGYNYDATDGCTAIETTAGTYSMAVLYPYKQGPSNGNGFYFPGDATTTTYAWASNTVTVASGSTTFTQDVADNLFPGAVVGFTTSSTDMTLLCAATVATTPVAGGTTFTTTTAPTKFTTGYGVKDCADSTVTTTAAVRHMVIYGASNALFFTDDDDENPNKFSNFNAGDWVTVTGSTASVGGSSEAPVTVNVESASASSLVFSMGSKPNGGGMYSVLPARSTSNVNLPVESTYLSTGPAVTHVPTTIGSGEPGQSLLVQMYSSTAAAATDTAAIDSAAVVKRVLEELPNQALPSVAVTMTSNALSLYAYTITFSNPNGSGGTGDQHNIILNSKGCNLDGCQPRYDGVRTQYAIVDNSITVDATAGTIAGTSVATSVSGLAAGGGDVVTTYGQNVKTGESLKTSSVSSTTAVVIGKATGASAGVATFVVAKASGDVSSWTTGSGFKSVTYEVTRGTDESAECANRGNCNRDDGTCECASGYTGAACTTQTVIM